MNNRQNSHFLDPQQGGHCLDELTAQIHDLIAMKVSGNTVAGYDLIH